MPGTLIAESTPASRTVALTHVLLIDGTGKPPVADATILIADGMITAVGTGLPVPPDCSVIDLDGRTVIPGLIDAHVHLGAQVRIPDFSKTVFMGGSEKIFGGADFTDNFLSARQDSLRYGLTTVRSCGDFLHDVLALRDSVERGVVLGPRVVAAGPSFQVQDGHPNATVWGSDPETVLEAARMPESAVDAVWMVEDLARTGVDFIKVIVENGKIGKRKGAFRKLSWEIVGAIVEAAHRAGLKVTSHIETSRMPPRLSNWGSTRFRISCCMRRISMSQPSTRFSATWHCAARSWSRPWLSPQSRCRCPSPRWISAACNSATSWSGAPMNWV
ncbi:MAG: hypothetical protein EOR16_15765 [Mesorhizobium sp.]|nr:MAG: hypothetical protein EOR16_15765 [Mesorhizobium sp.]